MAAHRPFVITVCPFLLPDTQVRRKTFVNALVNSVLGDRDPVWNIVKQFQHHLIKLSLQEVIQAVSLLNGMQIPEVEELDDCKR